MSITTLKEERSASAARSQKILYAIQVVHAGQFVQLMDYFAHTLEASQHMLTLYPYASCVGVRPATLAEQLAHQDGAPC